MTTSLVNAALLLPDGTRTAANLTMNAGVIKTIGPIAASNNTSEKCYNALGLLVLPGMVDIHGDAFERQLMPRPGVHMPPALALSETDCQMIANGITTAYHGVTVSWETGLRGLSSASAILKQIRNQRSALRCDTRIHLRLETHAFEAATTVARWIESGDIDLLAFNDHTAHIAHKLSVADAQTLLSRTGLTLDAYRSQFARVIARNDKAPAMISRLAHLARSRNIPMASHDDESKLIRRWYHRLGCSICEFPVCMHAARAAVHYANPVVMGAPNVLKGSSHCNRLSARDLIAQGLCSILSSDYFYPALLYAPFVLAQNQVLPLYEAWRLVSRNPAEALGLDDRGIIAPGKRADLIVIDDRKVFPPQVVAVFSAGRLVYLTENRMHMSSAFERRQSAA